MKKLNNKGFTLVEVLAVLAILVVIMSISIPNISSSLQRSKDKQNKARKNVLEAYAELYVSDNKNAVYQNLGSNNYCYITLTELREYASEEELKDSDGNPFTGVIVFSKQNNDYQYSENDGGYHYTEEDESSSLVSLSCK